MFESIGYLPLFYENIFNWINVTKYDWIIYSKEMIHTKNSWP